MPALGLFLIVGGVSEGGVVAVGGFLGALLAVGAGIRSCQLRIVLGNGVTVVNWFRTYEIPWAEVDRFVYEGKEVWVRTRNGPSITVAAFAAPPGALPFVARRNQQLARQLESVRKKRRGHGGGVDRPRPGT